MWSSDKQRNTGLLHVQKARYGPAQENITVEFLFDGFRFKEIGLRVGAP
jgi:hypothetical protein